MPDMKERKQSAKVVRKSKVIYYMADEDLKYLKKKTRYTEGELRYTKVPILQVVLLFRMQL